MMESDHFYIIVPLMSLRVEPLATASRAIALLLMNDGNLLLGKLNIRETEFSVKARNHKLWESLPHLFGRRSGAKRIRRSVAKEYLINKGLRLKASRDIEKFEKEKSLEVGNTPKKL
jgi:hypothetical protein